MPLRNIHQEAPASTSAFSNGGHTYPRLKTPHPTAPPSSSPHLPTPTVTMASTCSTYRVTQKPINNPRPITILTIGHGASSLALSHTLRQTLPPNSYTQVTFEKNSSLGGTWFENRYPGCRCDVPSHSYQFSWRPNYEWSNFFAPAEEIRQYLERVSEEEKLGEGVRYNTTVIGCRWVERTGTWVVRVREEGKGEEEVEGDFLVDCSGILK